MVTPPIPTQNHVPDSPKTFNRFYKSQDWYYGLDPFPELVEFLPKCDLPKEPLALDLGCGEGRDSIYLASCGFAVHSIDISKSGIEKLEKFTSEQNLRITPRVQNVLDFEFTPGIYDLVIARTFLGSTPLNRGG